MIDKGELITPPVNRTTRKIPPGFEFCKNTNWSSIVNAYADTELKQLLSKLFDPRAKANSHTGEQHGNQWGIMVKSQRGLLLREALERLASYLILENTIQ
ncbi:hypothetical protein PPACK8108_LOCUS5772 [Phakopsora pachyrhizi]|uniref:Uncharacterized protein n=1 Tax=Phakopsora pachyrhizi TaxID=170000 RepID=A0AAV0AT40_PHAPC|nr:hypothetical protein PPACK8108_LOCUS5772 [Phakopsora pachyrhizi]